MKGKLETGLLVLVILLSFCNGYGEATEMTAAQKEQIVIQENFDQWKGLGFGMAIGIAFPFNSIIESYEIINNILQIKNERTAIGQVMLESHYFVPVRRPVEASSIRVLKAINKEYIESLRSDDREKQERLQEKYKAALEAYEAQKRIRGVGVGPFVCFVPGTDKIFKAIGLGVMLGLRRGNTSNSFNIGLGYINYSDSTILPGSIKNGDAITSASSDITVQTNVGGAVVLFSFSF